MEQFLSESKDILITIQNCKTLKYVYDSYTIDDNEKIITEYETYIDSMFEAVIKYHKTVDDLKKKFKSFTSTYKESEDPSIQKIVEIVALKYTQFQGNTIIYI